MDKNEFKFLRSKLKKTQKQMAQLLGTSLKAIHSYEQGWRSVPVHVERQVFFLVSRQKALLDDPKMLDRTKTPMPGMGVFIRGSLLVY
jgi:hypothetical protein